MDQKQPFNHTIGRVIVRTRNMRLEDLTFARLLKPFENDGLVYDLPNTASCQLAFTHDLFLSNNTNLVGWSNALTNDNKRVTPSQFYEALHKHSDLIPVLYIANHLGNGHFNKIEAVTDYHQLQSLLGTLHSHGKIKKTYNML